MATQTDPFGNGNGQAPPPNPHTAAGRAFGKTGPQLSDLGLTGQGHPQASSGPWQAYNPQYGHPQYGQFAPPGRGHNRSQGIAQLAASIGEMELSSQDDLHAFCDAYRHLLNYLAVSAHLAQGQLKAAAKANAKQTKDGWMSPAQRIQLAGALRTVGKDLDNLAEHCVAGATDAIKAWGTFQKLLDTLENSNDKVRRPGNRRGGFTIAQG